MENNETVIGEIDHLLPHQKKRRDHPDQERLGLLLWR
jgi:hypothetical protein